MVQVPFTPTVRVRAPSGIRQQYVTARGATPEAFGAGLGSTIAKFGAVLQQRQEDQDKFVTQAEFYRFNNEVTQDFEGAKAHMPADGKDAAVGLAQVYDRRWQEFFQSVPESLKAEYMVRGEQLRGKFETDAVQFQEKAQTGFQLSTLQRQTNDAQVAVGQDPSKLDEWKGTIKQSIDLIPMDPTDRVKMQDAANTMLEEAALQQTAKQVYTPPANSTQISRGKTVSNFYEGVATSMGAKNPAVVAAALGGHAIAESGATSKFGKGGDNGSAFGIFQWRGERLANLKKFAADKGADPQDMQTQLEFARWEGESGADPGARRAWQELMVAETPEAAVAAWMHFERPQGYTAANPAGGHNYKGRLAYARQLLGLPTSSGDELMSDPRFVNVGYQRKQALVADGFRQANEASAAQEQQEKLAYETKFNDLLVGLRDGTYGVKDVQAAEQGGWLTDYDDLAKADRVLEARNKGTEDLREAVAALGNPGYVWNPTDSESKKYAETLFDAWGTAGRIQERDSNAVQTEIVPFVERTGMFPPNMFGVMQTMLRSSNSEDINWGFSQLDMLERIAPRAFQQDAPDGMFSDLNRWRTLSQYTPPEELAERFRKSKDPAALASERRLQEEGTKVANKMDLQQIVDRFDPGMFVAGPDAPAQPMEQAELRNDFATVYAEQFAISGESEQTMENTTKILGQRWGSSTVGGEKRLMKFAPELKMPMIDGSHDWLREQVRSEVEVGDREEVILVADQETEAQWNRGDNPTYLVVKKDELGIPRPVLEPGKRFRFDAKPYLERSVERLNEQSALSERRKARFEAYMYGTEVPQDVDAAGRAAEQQVMDRQIEDNAARKPRPGMQVPRQTTPESEEFRRRNNMSVPNADR